MKWTRLALKTLTVVAGAALISSAVVHWQASRREAAAEAAYPPTGQLVEVDGVKVHVHVEGDGPDLVLIHGASGNTREFTFQFVDRIKDRYRVFVVDRPGLGWTDRAGPGFGGALNVAAESPREQARLLQRAVAELGAVRPLVLGQSYGGSVALAWALEFPDAVSGLVIVSGASNPWPGGLNPIYPINASRTGASVVVPLLTAFAPRTGMDRVVGIIFAPQKAPEGYLDALGPGLSARRASLRANARQINSLKPHVIEMSKLYPSIDVPVEIIHGTADEIVPLKIHSEPLAEAIPGAVLTRLEGIGHMPHHVAPEAVVDAIDRAAGRAALR